MRAQFIKACQDPQDLPEEELSEIAIAGRSNCGKSSLINALTAHHKLARTSSTPGRTRDLIFFRVEFSKEQAFHLVDLPGYGYAKVSLSAKDDWARLVNGYIDSSQRLRALFILADIRRSLGQEESDLIKWCEARSIVPIVILTKADKLAKNKQFSAIAKAKKQVGLKTKPITTSAQTGQNIEVLRKRITELLFSDE